MTCHFGTEVLAPSPCSRHRDYVPWPQVVHLRDARLFPPFQYNLVSRKMARRAFGGDIMPALDGSIALASYLEFFQITREGSQAGIVEINL